MLVRWIVPFHVLSVITFFLAHGAGAAMAFRIRKETSLERMRAMLDLSSTPVLFLCWRTSPWPSHGSSWSSCWACGVAAGSGSLWS